MHATSMPLDACESPAQACARSAESDELYRIEKASMVLIVAEPQATVQAFYVPHRSGGLSWSETVSFFGLSSTTSTSLITSFRREAVFLRAETTSNCN